MSDPVAASYSSEQAIEALSALAQERRLAVFRYLVQAGEGRPAGEIARELELPHNTLSTHLAHLSRAGLLSAERQGRSIIYSVDLAGTRALLGFLLEDCCQGSATACGVALDSILTDCC